MRPRGAAALAAAAMLACAACGGSLGEGADAVIGTFQEMGRPNARDVELARQMGAPEEVVERLERGEWPQSGAKRMIDFAEEALAYARDSYGLECEAVKADNPGMFSHTAVVTLRLASGEHAGEEFRVDIDTGASPHSYRDSLYWNYHHEEFERECKEALEEVLRDYPKESVRYGYLFHENTTDRELLPLDAPLEQAGRSSGEVDAYLSPTLGLSDEDLDSLLASLKARMEEIGPMVFIYVNEASVAPPDGVLTGDFLSEIANDYDTYGEPYSRKLEAVANPQREEADES